MATLDDGVLNLQRFVASLVTATEALGKIGDFVKALDNGLNELDHEGAAAGLDDHLGEMSTALDGGEAEARQALTDLIHAVASEEQTIGAARDKVEHAASDVQEKARAVMTDVEGAHDTLSSEGFQPLAHTLDQAEQDLQSEAQEEDQALQDLDTAVQGFASEAQSAWSEADTALDGATHHLGEGQSSVESEATEGVHAFETLGGEIESFCTSLEGELEVIYGALTSGTDAQGHEWDQGVQNLAQQAVTFLEGGQQERVVQPAAMVADEAMKPLSQEYATVGAVLDVAVAAAGELEPLSGELAKSQTVVAQVDELMNALAG